MPTIIPNPWVLLAFVLSLLGVGWWGYHEGVQTGSERVQSAWTAADNTLLALRAKNASAARLREQGLQQAADDQRKTDAENNAALDARLRAALAELRDRPARPAGPDAAVPALAGAGPRGGCTGAGLYGDDAQLLTRLADAAQRVRAQRDSCYSAYERGRKALEEGAVTPR